MVRLVCLSLAVMFLTLPSVAASTSTSDAGSAPQRPVGPVVTIASSGDWTLKAWRSKSGLCVEYRPHTGRLCHFRLYLRTYLFAFFGWASPRQRLVLGAIAPRVRSVRARDADGTTAVRIFEAPRKLGTTLRFFRVVLRPGSPPRWRVTAYDSAGKRVGFVGRGAG